MLYQPAKYQGAVRGTPRLIVLHSMEAPEKGTTAEATARYFSNITKPASAHYCIDADSVVQGVYDNRVAYAAPGANQHGLQFEMAGYARQSRDEWLDPYSRATISLAAQLAAFKCVQHGIPTTWLSEQDLRAGLTRGITTHAAVAKAFGKSTHWDPGPAFPADVFMGIVLPLVTNAIRTPAPSETPHPTSPALPVRPTLQAFSTGPCVKAYKQTLALVSGGWNPQAGFIESDRFDGPTVERTKNVQRVLGLTADGVAGQKTWNAVDFLLVAKGGQPIPC